MKASAPKDLKEVTSAGEATGWARSNRKNSSSLGDQPRVNLFLSSLETLPEPFYAHSLLEHSSLPPDRSLFGFYSRRVRAEPPEGASVGDVEYFAPLGVISLVR